MQIYKFSILSIQSQLAMQFQRLMLVVCLALGFGDPVMTIYNESVDCSFSSENMCGYTNTLNVDSEMKWQIRMAPIPQRDAAEMERPPHSQYYISTGPTEEERFHGMFAEIESPEFQVTNGSKCLYFSYHNRLPFQLIPTLEVRMRMENISDRVIASYLSLNSSKWFEAQVRLPIGEYRIVFAGKNYYRMFIEGGVVAVTNIAVLDGNCARSIPEWMERPGDCGFENGLEVCGYEYTNDSTARFLEFRTESLNPPENHLAPKDRFLAITGKYHQITSHDSRSRIQSPEIVIENEGCLYLWYFNSVPSSNEGDNVLNVLLKTQQVTEPTVLFRLPISKNNKDRWYQLSGALPRGRFRLILEAIYTRDFRVDDYVGFDNVEIFNRSCLDLENMKNACVIAQSSNRSLCKNGGTCSGSGKKSFRCACPENFYGDLCEFSYPCAAKSNSCQNGGSCMDDGRIGMSCKCRSGFTGHLCNERRKCGAPEKAIANAELSLLLNDTFQSTARFECLSGFFGVGTLIATCSAAGVWVSEESCYEVRCQDPPGVIGNARLLSVSNHTGNGQAKYGCQDGFIFLIESKSFLICRPNTQHYMDEDEYGDTYYNYGRVDGVVVGWWVNFEGHRNRISCQAIPNCGTAPQFAYSVLEAVTDTYFNGTASYRCLDGYQVNVPTNGTYKTTFTLKCSDRWIPEVGNVMYECWAVPYCGKPPNITHGKVVKVIGDTGLNSSAVYRCNSGYRLIGIDTAICLIMRNNRKQKWLEWQFVPSCEMICPAKVGLQGNVSSIILAVTRCSVSSWSSKLECGQPFESAIKRQSGKNVNKESVVFYGDEICIAEWKTRLLIVKDEATGDIVTYSNVTRCHSFCLQQPSDIYYLPVHEKYFYRSEMQTYHNQRQQPYEQYPVGTNLVRREIIKYAVRLFA